ncbi:MAG: polyphosphate kinase [Candidatus Mycalebacterium zealandia]|nr:MAG: polyphosphate kinase [Candidatus Mycalebacterium zealandia]
MGSARKVKNGLSEHKKFKGIVRRIETVYENISPAKYPNEKRRLQYELLKIQQDVVKHGRRLAIVFEGRDAAGKGSTIKRFTEHMMPRHYRIVELGVPTPKESKNWLRRYMEHMPCKGEIVFFDRSWYTRALVHSTMGYCTKAQYRYFMENVLKWEEGLFDRGIEVVKFYLSVDIKTQLVRFNERMKDPLKFWKLSPHDLKARNKWARFSRYKEQMFQRTSSEDLPWVVINSNSKREAALTCMLYLARLNGADFTPLTGELMETEYEIDFKGVNFKGLTARQYAVIAGLIEQEKHADV